MLVLSRRQGESVVATINGVDIEFVILELRTDARQVRVGINAPKNVSINRREVLERVGLR